MSEKDFVKFEKSYRQYYGENYDKALKNLRLAKKRLRYEFERKYPTAEVSRFSFNVILSKTGDVTGTSTSYKIRDGQYLNITTHTFKRLYSGELYWYLRIWDPSGTVQPLVLPYDVTKFDIYVTGTGSFQSNFEGLNTSWTGTAKDITKMKVDKEDLYFASLLAACIISHKSGISRKHLTGDTPKIITSIARYYIYYHMKRFLRDPRKMDSFITNDMLELVKKNIPTRTVWTNKFARTRANLGTWLNKQPNKHNIRHPKYRMSRNHTGILGIEYQEVERVVNKGDDDWVSFIKSDSDGLTKTGQKLFQNAIESYVTACWVPRHKRAGL